MEDIVGNFEVLVDATFGFVAVDTFHIFVVADFAGMVTNCVHYGEREKIQYKLVLFKGVWRYIKVLPHRCPCKGSSPLHN